MDTNVTSVTENTSASPLETMHEAVRRAQATFLRDLTKRIKACRETLGVCVEDLEEARLNLSSDVLKIYRAADKHLSLLIDELEAECPDLTEQSSG
jgi:hypothetical protein